MKRKVGTRCNHLMKWSAGKGKRNKGTGTTGLGLHIQNKHPNEYKEAMEVLDMQEEGKAPVGAAIYRQQNYRRVLLIVPPPK